MAKIEQFKKFLDKNPDFKKIVIFMIYFSILWFLLFMSMRWFNDSIWKILNLSFDFRMYMWLLVFVLWLKWVFIFSWLIWEFLESEEKFDRENYITDLETKIYWLERENKQLKEENSFLSDNNKY